MIHGPDVSSWQGAVDWQAVKASGSDIGLCKASEGVGYVDPEFAGNWPALHASGLDFRGAYHFGRPDLGNSAEAEAAWFLQTVAAHGGFQPGDFAMLDIENATPTVATWCLQFLNHVAANVPQGVRPLFYSYLSFVEEHGFAAVPDLAQYPLDLAAYGPNEPAPPAPWSTITIWQHADDASIPGVSGKVDDNLLETPPAPTVPEDSDAMTPELALDIARTDLPLIFGRTMDANAVNDYAGDVQSMGAASARDKWETIATQNGEISLLSRLQTVATHADALAATVATIQTNAATTETQLAAVAKAVTDLTAAVSAAQAPGDAAIGAAVSKAIGEALPTVVQAAVAAAVPGAVASVLAPLQSIIGDAARLVVDLQHVVSPPAAPAA